MKRKLLLLLLLVLLSLSAFAAEAPESGITLTANDRYETMGALPAVPRTVEVWLKADADAPDARMGVLCGTFDSTVAKGNFMYDIRTGGNPYIWWKPSGVAEVRTQFTNVDIRTGEWIHLVITVAADKSCCYVNGELKQTVAATYADMPASTLSPVMVGGDYREGNTEYLKYTEMGAFRFYSEARTAEQVKASYEAFSNNVSTLLGAYDFSKSGAERLQDHSSQKNHLEYVCHVDTTKNERFFERAEGLTFENTFRYPMPALSAAPQTIEAEVYFPENTDTTVRNGTVIGNYADEYNASFVEIYAGGIVRYYCRAQDGTYYDIRFSGADVVTGEWVQLAVTHEFATGIVKCYVDGELISTVTKQTLVVPTNTNYWIGGDSRSGNPQFFRGNLRSVKLYSDVRTADEVKADMMSLSKDDLLCAYDFSDVVAPARPAVLTDLSGNGKDVPYTPYWVSGPSKFSDYAYSMAVIGDTQKMSIGYPEYASCLYDWIVANAEAKKMAFVIGLGDITDLDKATEWSNMAAEIAKMDGVVPYSLVRGNHDSTAKYDAAFLGTAYEAAVKANGGVMTEGSLENCYQTFKAGEEDYLILCIDFGPSDAELAWASEIIEAHPAHKVIIATHAYLNYDGTTLDKNDEYAPTTFAATKNNNNGDGIWEKLASRHENVVLILSGHIGYDEIVMRKDVGVHGNTVTQLLVDPQTTEYYQGPIGMVTMLYFSEDGQVLSVEHYSTVKDAYFLEKNRYSIPFNEIAGDVNLDYSVDVQDVLLALDSLLNDKTAGRADINADGMDFLDIVRILQKIVE